MISVFWHLWEKFTRIEIQLVNSEKSTIFEYHNCTIVFACEILLIMILHLILFVWIAAILFSFITLFWLGFYLAFDLVGVWISLLTILVYSIYFLLGIMRWIIIVVVKLENGMKKHIEHVAYNKIWTSIVWSYYLVLLYQAT